MNYSIYRFTLDLQKHQSQMSISVFKNDTAIRLLIGLTDGGKPYHINDGIQAILYGKRADDKEIIHRCMIKDNAEIIYDFEETTACKDGLVQCQLRLYGLDGHLITAPRFVIVVDERIVDDAAVEIDSDRFTALDGIFLAENERVGAEDAREVAEKARDDAEKARDEAEIRRDETVANLSASMDNVLAEIGDIDTALGSIIAIQESLIGGEEE